MALSARLDAGPVKKNWTVFIQTHARLAKTDSPQEFFLLLALRQFTYYK
jgi:hypothetical protein